MKDLVVPFRGERYRETERLSRLIAPPYDVIDQARRAQLAALDDHNIVHLMLPEAPPAPPVDRYAWAAEQLAVWRRSGVLVRDTEPAVYVMAQGVRLGVFAALAAEGYEPRRVRPHEKTHAGPKADRLALLRATRTNLESIFLLAPDRDRSLAHALAEVATRSPDATAELDGAAIRFWVVRGADLSRFPFPGAPLYMADGHHRYETACAYARENPAADRVLGFVASAADPGGGGGLVVLPTHRLIYGSGRRPDAMLTAWRPWFDVTRVPVGVDPVAYLAELGRDRTACLVASPDGSVLALALKPDARLEEVRDLGASPAVRALDVARVEALVVRPILHADTSTPTLRYTADPVEALASVRQGASAAVLLNPTRVEQVFAVADAGDVMPPKSTYFAPKVPSGLVLKPCEE
jgi:uncharacterized protein (DUF1015 family)